MEKESQDYIAYLVKIGRKCFDELTAYESAHLTGLIIKEKLPPFKIEFSEDVNKEFIDWMIDNENYHPFFSAIRSCTINQYSSSIDLLLKDYIKNTTKISGIDENRPCIY